MSKPDFAEPLAPRNLAIFDDALEHYGALDSLYENDMLGAGRARRAVEL